MKNDKTLMFAISNSLSKSEAVSLAKTMNSGNQYVFVAMDAETELVPAYKAGKRTMDTTRSFIKDLQYRIITRFQLSTDSSKPYFNVVDEIFGEDVDYGKIH